MRNNTKFNGEQSSILNTQNTQDKGLLKPKKVIRLKERMKTDFSFLLE